MSRTLKLSSAVWLTVVALLVGVALGLCLDRLAISYRLWRVPRSRMHEHMMARLQRDLDLTAGQRAAVDSLFRSQRARVERMRRQMEGTFGAGQDSFSSALAKVLTPDQMRKFRQMIPPRPPGWGPGMGPPGFREPHPPGGPRDKGPPP
ncbi:MAG TPA: hypothetical protein VMS93_01860 [Candidatus Saccharimonadales bacterium]|nr:hypothetical protein [Candidatus Saccharimonadales bacterium]